MNLNSGASLTPEEEARYAALQLRALDDARDGATAELEAMIAAGLPANLSDTKGNSLLMLAAYHGHEDTARMLLRRGADPDRRNDRGQTPLGGVAFKGHLPLVRLLIEAGAQVDADQGGGRSPLMFAAMFGHRKVVECLLAAGADPSRQSVFGLSTRQLAGITGAIRSWFSAPGRGGN